MSDNLYYLSFCGLKIIVLLARISGAFYSAPLQQNDKAITPSTITIAGSFRVSLVIKREGARKDFGEYVLALL